MVRNLKSALGTGLYTIRKIIKSQEVGSHLRPVGEMIMLLQDLKKRGLNCKTILDVGANRGDWSRIAKSVYPDAEICLIEPQIEMKEELELFCREHSNATYIMAGAGPERSVMTFTVWNDLAGSSFLPGADDSLKNKGRQREVDVIPIDELIATSRLRMPELIKLDIQGFELEVLKGAKSTFGNTLVYILEVSLFPFSDLPGIPSFCDVINFMQERGYVVYDFGGFMRRTLDGALGQCDICFVKEDCFLRAEKTWS